MDLKAFIKQHKVKFSFVGGALVMSTAYGSCNLEPASEQPAAEEPAEEAVPAEADDAAPEEGEEAAGEE